jgi:predicted MFS family arabinose efflux permease
MAAATTTRAPGRARALLGFAAFGLFWGSWGGALPAVRAHAGVDDGALGLALLCIGAGALASMRPAGAILDRYGTRVLPLAMAVFAGCAVLPALATSAVALSAALLALGAAAGAVDVAINAEGVRAEAAADRPLMSLAHAAFSATVVAASLLAGALRAAGAEVGAIFAVVAALLLVVAVALQRLPAAGARPAVPAGGGLRAMLHVPAWLAVIGGLTALAYFIENAWQSWSAVHLEATLGAVPAVAALGPALFAGAAATGRVFGQAVARRVEDRALVRAGSALAALGTLVAATAPTTAVALAGIAVAGLGTSVCAPVLISLAGRHAEPAARASAVSIVTTLAYLGFLVGPAAVGLAADALSLRAALGAVAGLSLVLAGLVRMAPAAPARATARSREKHRGKGFPSGPDPCSTAEPTE